MKDSFGKPIGKFSPVKTIKSVGNLGEKSEFGTKLKDSILKKSRYIIIWKMDAKNEKVHSNQKGRD